MLIKTRWWCVGVCVCVSRCEELTVCLVSKNVCPSSGHVERSVNGDIWSWGSSAANQKALIFNVRKRRRTLCSLLRTLWRIDYEEQE